MNIEYDLNYFFAELQKEKSAENIRACSTTPERTKTTLTTR